VLAGSPLLLLALLAAPDPGGAAGQDFAEEVRLWFRVAACSGDVALPPNIDPKIVAEHCALLGKKIERYRKTYLGVAQPFLRGLEPSGLPTSVVYPFGGGDLLSALTAYPDAQEITTVSLEYSGDPRRIRTTDNKRLKAGLALLRLTISQLLALDDSASEDLKKLQRGDLPGQLLFFLIGLAVHGYRPTHLYYFQLEDGGAIHYLSADEIAAKESTKAERLFPSWDAPDFSVAFSNLELRFERAGTATASGGGARVHRHLAMNLDDAHLAQDHAVLPHLVAKGSVSSLIKASSFLLWRDDFTKIRGYLLDHAVFMLSDSTGIPPEIAEKAGYRQTTYGRFDGPFLSGSPTISDRFRKLWNSQPARPISFRFGYGDIKHQPHLLVTQRSPEPHSP
jgi:hypothetical protein